MYRSLKKMCSTNIKKGDTKMKWSHRKKYLYTKNQINFSNFCDIFFFLKRQHAFPRKNSVFVYLYLFFLETQQCNCYMLSLYLCWFASPFVYMCRQYITMTSVQIKNSAKTCNWCIVNWVFDNMTERFLKK